MILDIEQKSHELAISYFNKEGNIDFFHLKIPNEERFNWEETRNGGEDRIQSWDNKTVKKVMVGDVRKLNKYRIAEILLKYQDQLGVLQEFNMPRKYFMDIEVEVLDGFPDPDIAGNRITTIAIANSQTNTVNVLGITPLEEQACYDIERDINKHFAKFHEKWTFRYFYFESEYDMMYTFFKKMMPQFACVSGWNFTDYDWKYIMNRVDRINRNLPADKKIMPEWSSPSGKILGKNRFPQHRLIVDYLEIYKKWDRVVKIKENNKLDYVAMQALGIEKIKYNGTIKDLFEKDYVKYVFYNAVDAVLVHYIDKKLNTMLTFLKLGHVTGVEAKKAYSPIWMMESMAGKEFLNDDKVFIYKGGNDDIEQKPFEGAYVKEPVRGLHQWVVCYDFASLYPNTMMQFNISMETFIGNNIEPKAGEIKVGVHQGEGGLSWRVFNNEKPSVLKRVLTGMYAKRRETKQKYLTINKEIDALEKHLAGQKIIN